MPSPTFHESYPAMYGGLFLAAFAMASMMALLAGVLLMVREVPLRRAIACASLVVVAVALAASCAEVLRHRESTDALLSRPPLARPCRFELVRHEGYGQARESAALALWAAPFALVVATFVAARSLRRQAFLGWVTVPWALFAAAGFLYLQPVPGRYLWAGRCELYDDRDAILGSDPEKRASACVELSGWVKDPRTMEGMLGTDSVETALPELPRLKRRCLDDMIDLLRQAHPRYSISRVEVLHSPFLEPGDTAEVTKTLDEIEPLKKGGVR
ncbi:MAG: hypothetical protein ACHREM_33745 [Polyangiales bacterium]